MAEEKTTSPKKVMNELYGYDEEEEEKEKSFLEMIAESLKAKEDKAIKPLKTMT